MMSVRVGDDGARGDYCCNYILMSIIVVIVACLIMSQNSNLNLMNEELRNMRIEIKMMERELKMESKNQDHDLELVKYELKTMKEDEKRIFDDITQKLSKIEKKVNTAEQQLKKDKSECEKNTEQKFESLNSSFERSMSDIDQVVSDNFIETQRRIQLINERLTPHSKYIAERRKTLQGIEWSHEWADSEETIEGPAFYLGHCRLRVQVKFIIRNGKYCADYWVMRLNGNYDDLISQCRITYTQHFYVNVEDGVRSEVWEREIDIDLDEDSQMNINYNYLINRPTEMGFITKKKLTVKIYFDTEGFIGAYWDLLG